MRPYNACVIVFCMVQVLLQAPACTGLDIRAAGSVLSSVLLMTLLPMADWFGGADKAKGYQMAMTVLAFIGMCMFLFCFATVRERIRPRRCRRMTN